MNALDTHGLVKRLMAAGFPEPQAEAVTDVVREGREFDLSNLATKADMLSIKAEIPELRAGTKADIAELRAGNKAEIGGLRSGTKADLAELRTFIAETKADILKWVIGLFLAQVGATITTVKLIAGH